MFSPEDHRVRPVDVAPHGLEFAVSVEDLDPVGFTVNYIHVGVAVDCYVMRADELAGVNARAAPGELVFAGAGVDVDSGVAVPV